MNARTCSSHAGEGAPAGLLNEMELETPSGDLHSVVERGRD